MFALSEPMMKFDGTPVAIAAREEQTRRMLDSLYFRLAEVTGREVDELRDDARARRVLTVAEARGTALSPGGSNGADGSERGRRGRRGRRV